MGAWYLGNCMVMKMKSMIWLVMVFFGSLLVGCKTWVPNQPADVTEVRPASPSQNYVWRNGNWHPQRRAYVYRQGYWTPPRNNRVYVSGRWVKTNRGFYWQNGHWQR